MLLLIWLAFIIYFPVNDLYFNSNISNKEKKKKSGNDEKYRIFKEKRTLRERKKGKRGAVIRQQIQQQPATIVRVMDCVYSESKNDSGSYQASLVAACFVGIPTG